jgi:hypothetical protein
MPASCSLLIPRLSCAVATDFAFAPFLADSESSPEFAGEDDASSDEVVDDDWQA